MFAIGINAGTQHDKQIYCVIKQGETLKLWAQQNAGVYLVALGERISLCLCDRNHS